MADPAHRRAIFRPGSAASRTPRSPHTRAWTSPTGATRDEQIRMLLRRTRADLPHASARRLREVLQERLCRAGIDLPADAVEEYLRRPHTALPDQ